jgi:hypothetical protein
MFLSALREKNRALLRTTLRIWEGVIKPQPFNNSKTSFKFWLKFAQSNFLLCLKAFAISSGVKLQLLIKNSVATSLPGGVVDGADIWVQNLGNVISDLTVNSNARGGVAFNKGIG